MKKSLIAIIGAAALMACGGNKYTVSGTIEGIADGEYVTINDISNGVSLQPIDSVQVQNGKYKLQGETDTCSICVLSFNLDGDMATCTFFLEPGRIKLNFKNDTQTVGGTRSNDGFQKFYDQVDEMNNKAQDLQERMQKAMTNGEDMGSYQDEMDDIQDNYKEIVANSIRENADNIFGFNQLVDMFSMFEPDELSELIELVKPAYGQHEYIQQLGEMVASQLKTAIGQQYSDVTALCLDGNELRDATLSEYVSQNKLVLLDFWASWCAPCRSEIPYLKEAYEKYHSQGFEIVSISVDEDMNAWKDAMDEEGMTWPQLYDASTGEGSPAYIYAVTAIPASFLIDSEGTIISHNLRGEEYEDVLSDYFGE